MWRGAGPHDMNESMSAVPPPGREAGITLRQAALIGGFGVLVMLFAAPFAEYVVYAKLVVPGDIEQSVRNMLAGIWLLRAALFAYLATFVCDVLVAWAFYVLLVPVDRALSLLTAWFRLVYTAIALVAFAKLVTVYRLLIAADSAQASVTARFPAQLDLLLNSFRYEWHMGLLLFGVHLGLLGYLVYRADYIPGILGILLAISGLGYLLYYASPYLYPGADPSFIMVTFFAEPIFMVWLLARGWKIEQASAHS